MSECSDCGFREESDPRIDIVTECAVEQERGQRVRLDDATHINKHTHIHTHTHTKQQLNNGWEGGTMAPCSILSIMSGNCRQAQAKTTTAAFE